MREVSKATEVADTGAAVRMNWCHNAVMATQRGLIDLSRRTTSSRKADPHASYATRADDAAAGTSSMPEASIPFRGGHIRPAKVKGVQNQSQGGKCSPEAGWPIEAALRTARDFPAPREENLVFLPPVMRVGSAEVDTDTNRISGAKARPGGLEDPGLSKTRKDLTLLAAGADAIGSDARGRRERAGRRQGNAGEVGGSSRPQRRRSSSPSALNRYTCTCPSDSCLIGKALARTTRSLVLLQSHSARDPKLHRHTDSNIDWKKLCGATCLTEGQSTADQLRRRAHAFNDKPAAQPAAGSTDEGSQGAHTRGMKPAGQMNSAQARHARAEPALDSQQAMGRKPKTMSQETGAGLHPILIKSNSDGDVSERREMPISRKRYAV